MIPGTQGGRERSVAVRGLNLNLREWGPHTGPRFVLLHGWMEHGGFWLRIVPTLLEAGFRVTAPDARGHGRSGHAGPGAAYHFTDYLIDLDALLQEPAHVLGHSMGGTVACMFAAARPEKVLSLTLSEGLGPPSESASQAADRIRKHLDHMRRGWTSPPVSLDEAASRMLRGWPALDHETALILAAGQHDGHGWTYDALHKSRSAIGFHLDRHLEQLRRIQAPVALAFGTRSWYAGIDRLQERIHAVQPRHVAHLDAGHALHLEAPEGLAAIALKAAGETVQGPR